MTILKTKKITEKDIFKIINDKNIKYRDFIIKHLAIGSIRFNIEEIIKKLQELDCEIDEQTIRDKVKHFRLNWEYET